MALKAYVDYIFISNVWYISDEGIFLGTKTHLYYIPSLIRDWEYRTQTDTTYSVAGQDIVLAIEEILSHSDTTEASLMQTISTWKKDLPEIKIEEIKPLKNFKVTANFLGSGVMIRRQGSRGWELFCNKLGKQKKAAKAFYEHIERR